MVFLQHGSSNTTPCANRTKSKNPIWFRTAKNLIDKNSKGIFKIHQSSAEPFPKRLPKASAHPKNIPNGFWDSEEFQKCPLQKILWRFAEVEGMKGFRAFYSLPDSRFWKFCYGPFMTLLEIQKAAESLSIEVKRGLMIFLLRRLRDNQSELPPVRDIPNETIEK